MSGRMKLKLVYGITVVYGVVVALVLTLPACTDVKDFLCRPAGHCVNAPDRNTNYGP